MTLKPGHFHVRGADVVGKTEVRTVARNLCGAAPLQRVVSDGKREDCTSVGNAKAREVSPGVVSESDSRLGRSTICDRPCYFLPARGSSRTNVSMEQPGKHSDAWTLAVALSGYSRCNEAYMQHAEWFVRLRALGGDQPPSCFESAHLAQWKRETRLGNASIYRHRFNSGHHRFVPQLQPFALGSSGQQGWSSYCRKGLFVGDCK